MPEEKVATFQVLTAFIASALRSTVKFSDSHPSPHASQRCAEGATTAEVVSRRLHRQSCIHRLLAGSQPAGIIATMPQTEALPALLRPGASGKAASVRLSENFTIAQFQLRSPNKRRTRTHGRCGAAMGPNCNSGSVSCRHRPPPDFRTAAAGTGDEYRLDWLPVSTCRYAASPVQHPNDGRLSVPPEF